MELRRESFDSGSVRIALRMHATGDRTPDRELIFLTLVGEGGETALGGVTARTAFELLAGKTEAAAALEDGWVRLLVMGGPRSILDLERRGLEWWVKATAIGQDPIAMQVASDLTQCLLAAIERISGTTRSER